MSGTKPIALIVAIVMFYDWSTAVHYVGETVDFSETLKHAVVAGAVTGGGLTIIANAPNPAGISLLKKYFDHGVSPAGLLGAALVPTIIMFVLFLVTS